MVVVGVILFFHMLKIFLTSYLLYIVKKIGEREENGGGKGGDWRRKKKGKARGGGGKAFEKLKGKAPSDGVGQGKRVTGRSNW